MPKAATRQADNVIPMVAPDPPIAVMSAGDIGDAEIARRAFELYSARGGEDGYDLDDWLNAERELRGAATVSAA